MRRIAAIVEVVVAFVVVHLAYRSLKHFTLVGRWEGAAGTNFTPGVVMVGFTVAVLLVCGRSFQAYGLGLECWRQNLSLGLACSLMVIPIAALGLAVSGYQFDPSRPPDPYAQPDWLRLFIVSGFLLAGHLAVLGVVARRDGLFTGIPAAVTIPLIGALVAVPPVIALCLSRPPLWPTVLWLFFGAGFGEEIFFRGYVQSRVDQAFARRFHFLGIEFGVGLIVASLLFGLIHVLNTVDYFHGRFDFGWRAGVQSLFYGLFAGLIRARTGSVIPGAVEHGLSDVLGRVVLLLPTRT